MCACHRSGTGPGTLLALLVRTGALVRVLGQVQVDVVSVVLLVLQADQVCLSGRLGSRLRRGRSRAHWARGLLA
jgi:hypothetical protein